MRRWFTFSHIYTRKLLYVFTHILFSIRFFFGWHDSTETKVWIMMREKVGNFQTNIHPFKRMKFEIKKEETVLSWIKSRTLSTYLKQKVENHKVCDYILSMTWTNFEVIYVSHGFFLTHFFFFFFLLVLVYSAKEQIKTIDNACFFHSKAWNWLNIWEKKATISHWLLSCNIIQ